jgi:hypothetical protein
VLLRSSIIRWPAGVADRAEWLAASIRLGLLAPPRGPSSSPNVLPHHRDERVPTRSAAAPASAAGRSEIRPHHRSAVRRFFAEPRERRTDGAGGRFSKSGLASAPFSALRRRAVFRSVGRPCFSSRSRNASSASSWKSCIRSTRQQIERVPSLIVELNTLAGHRVGSICPFEVGLAGIMTGVCRDRPARHCDVLVRPDQTATAVCKAEYLMRWGGQCSARCTPQRPAAAGETLSRFRP